MKTNYTEVNKHSGVSDDLVSSQLTRFHEIVTCSAYGLYGTPLPEPVEDRIIWELKAIQSNGYRPRFICMRQTRQKIWPPDFTRNECVGGYIFETTTGCPRLSGVWLFEHQKRVDKLSKT